MSNAALSYYASQMRQHSLQIYVVNGQHVGHTHARACIREIAEVLAEMAGRESAVALLDEIAQAVLSQTKLPDMRELLAPPAAAPAPVPPSRWQRVWAVVSDPRSQYGAVVGFWLAMLPYTVWK